MEMFRFQESLEGISKFYIIFTRQQQKCDIITPEVLSKNREVAA